MSKLTMKIIYACAFVVLIALIVLGVSLSVSGAKACTLKIFDGGVEGGVGTSSNIAIYIDNQKQETNEVSVKKNTEVTVTFEGVGYDFVGWYNGNFAEINRDEDVAVNTSASYTFYLNQDTTLTAIRDVKNYTITYSGLMDDDSPVVVTPQTQQYKYGETLANLDSNTGSTFYGWYVNGSSDLTTYKTATFANSGEYTVKPSWENQMTIVYKDNSGFIIQQDKVSETSFQVYQLIGSDNENVISYIKDKKGYEFGYWVDQTGVNVIKDNISFETNSTFEIYIKLNPTTYTLSVQKSGIDESISEITYDIENGFSQYLESRDGYTFAGLIYNDVLYTFDEVKNDYLNNSVSLASIVLSKDLTNASVIAQWKCDYPNFLLFINGVSNYDIDGDNGNYEVFGKIGDNYEIISDLQHYIIFEDKIGENYFDTDSDIIDLMFGKYEGIYRQTGFDTGVYEKVELKAQDNVKIYINDLLAQPISFEITKGTLTFEQVFSLLSYKGVDLSTVYEITITFEFVLSQAN